MCKKCNGKGKEVKCRIPWKRKVPIFSLCFDLCLISTVCLLSLLTMMSRVSLGLSYIQESFNSLCTLPASELNAVGFSDESYCQHRIPPVAKTPKACLNPRMPIPFSNLASFFRTGSLPRFPSIFCQLFARSSRLFTLKDKHYLLSLN